MKASLLATGLASAGVAALWGQGAAAQGGPAAPRFPVAASTARCAEMAGLHFGPATVRSAELVPASRSEPEHCKVRGYKTGRHTMEMQALLPTSWDGKFVQLGVGGAKANVPNAPWNASTPLRQGMVQVSGSTGNDEASVSMAEPEVMKDWSYGAIGTIYEFGQAVMRSYYGVGPQYRYFMGCSGGGLDTLQAAAVYPDRYDGVIAQAPPHTRTSFIAYAWLLNALPEVSADRWALVNAGYIAMCDGLDGLKDGIVSNPGACPYDPTKAAAWTPDELKTITAIHQDYRLKDGTVVARRAGFGPSFARTLRAPTRPDRIFYGSTLSTGPRDINIDAYWERIKHNTDAVGLNVDPVAVAGFLKSGKKMILTMGADDTAFSVYGVRDWYDQVRAAAGPSADNLQLRWMMGVTHCGAGGYRDPNIKGPDRVEMLGSVRDWVEKGVKPTTIVASRHNADGSVMYARPVCESGFYARYNGAGDPNRAESFVCQRDPKAL